jgi:hypothetical protein
VEARVIVITAGLQTNVTSTYDKTKTTVFGRAYQKTINSQLVVGPPLTKAIDVFTDAAITPIDSFLTANNRLFVLSTIASAGTTIVLYNFNPSTGVATYIGKILFTLPNTAATTHTNRYFKVDDTNASAIKIFVGTTGSVLINGGIMMLNNINVTDFVPVGFPTIFQAIGNNTKSVYMLQDPAGLGVNNNMTALAGGACPSTYSANSAINTKVYLHNGLSATHQYFIHDYSISPTMTSQAATSSIGVTFTATGHSYATNDPIVITGTAPGGFTQTTGSAVQTVYFVRNPVAGVSFELSATSGGASISATTVQATTTYRAFGQTSALFTLKTGNLPALAGTLLLTDSEEYCVPSSTTNSGFDCIGLSTTTALYLGKLSDLTSGATTWPSLITSNVTGTGVDYTAITPAQSTYSTECDNFVFATNGSTFITKQLVNSVIRFSFGGLANQWIEGNNPVTLPFSLVTINSLGTKQGWVFITGATVGQRVCLAMDLRSDDFYGYSYVTTPVLSTPQAIAKLIDTWEQLFDLTDSINFYYRTAATSSDAIFNISTGGWISIPFAQNLTSYSFNNFTQFRLGFQIATLLANTPAQINELFLGVLLNNEISSYWEGSVDNTSSNGASPAYTAFRLTQAYATSVPTMYFRAYDDNGNLVASANTTSNPTFFQYSTNNGSSWNPLGTIPNTILTTELRYAWASPPGVKVTCSIRES